MSGVTLQGRRALVDKLGRLPPAARKHIRAAIAQSAREMAALVRAAAPVDTGQLRDSVGYTFGAFEENKRSRSRISSASAEGVADPDLTAQVHAGGGAAFYARFVEFGTRNPSRPARPFFYPALRLTRKKHMDRLKRATHKAAREVAKGGG
ncbi:MAG: HK97-gp10 family putative phage morphogenesis protein [Hyphomicrobiaceae bacterium]